MIHPDVMDQWFAACRSSDLKRVPRAFEWFGQPLVLFRTEAGVHALLDRCPHRHAPLSGGRLIGNHLQCRYHGWEFEGSGKCALVPGSTVDPPRYSVPSFRCQESDGVVWVATKNAPATPPPSLVFADIDRMKQVWSSFTVEGTLFDAIENFVDPMHTHTVHAGLIRTNKKRSPVRIEIRCEGAEVTATYRGEGASSGMIQQLFGLDIVRTLGRFRVPSIVEMEYYNERFMRFRIVLLFTPTAEGKIQVLAGVYGRHALAAVILPVLKPMLRLAVKQDRDVLSWKYAHESKYFGKGNYLHTELDLLGPYILQWLRHGKLKGDDRDIDIML